MANDQFHLPGYSLEQQSPQPIEEPREQMQRGPIADALRFADSMQYTPEKAPETFRFINDIANEIYSYRETALEADRKKSRGVLGAFGWLRKELTEAEIIDGVESTLVYGKDSDKRFWLGSKDEVQAGSRGTNVGEVAHFWFMQTKEMPNGTTDKTVIHYENHPSTFTKWFNHKPYPVMLNELGDFIDTAKRYRDLVCEKLSPVDASLHDLQDEIEQDERIVSRNKEVMFSKTAIDRMVAEHRAKLAAQEAMQQTETAQHRNQQNDYDLAA